MRDLHFISSLLDTHADSTMSILDAYSEPHRHFHTMDHVMSIVDQIEAHFGPDYSDTKLAFLYAAVFHDIVYVPGSKTNEADSVSVMRGEGKHIPSLDICVVPGHLVGLVEELILGTAEPVGSSASSRIFNSFDRSILLSDLPQLLDYGEKIYKEFSFVPYHEFVPAHLAVIRSLAHRPDNFDAYEACLLARKLRVAIFPGSFNPFHRGHLDVLMQAQAVFDKVVLARGMNTSKISNVPDMLLLSPDMKKFEPCEIAGVPRSFEVVRYIATLDELYSHYAQMPNHKSVTIVKGVRGTDDLQSELIQARFVSELAGTRVPYAFFSTAPELQHISSSAIRTLHSFGRNVAPYIP